MTSNPTSNSISEFRKGLIQEIENYFTWYIGMAEEMPDDFPLHRTYVEWFDDFLDYNSLEEK